MKERVVVEIFEQDRFLLAKGIFRLAEKVVEDSFEWRQLMNFRRVLITGGQIIALTSYRLKTLVDALNLLERNGVQTRTITLRKKLRVYMEGGA